MAWSEAARRAALEARRRKSKRRVTVSTAAGKKTTVTRQYYAQHLREVRHVTRHPNYRKAGEKRYGKAYNEMTRANAKNLSAIRQIRFGRSE